MREAFDALLRMPPGERARRLAEIGADDAAVAAEVASLLAEADSGPFLETPAVRLATREPPSSLRTFAAGDLVAGRFRIVRFIAEGGMGEIYEVEDELVHGRLALKTIRPVYAGDERTMRRFRREVALSRQVTHPNVCRVFDIGQHERAGGTTTTFLTMELLAGRPLRRVIEERGRLSTEEARPILQQMAEGLAAAHRQGIIHRDFKSDNVILVDEPGQPRVVVTDFGLAVKHEGGGSLTATNPDALIGTPAYMSPEQVESGRLTAASDVYALGVVAYEMVTGVLPFVAETPAATALKRIRESPRSPADHVPTLDPRWASVIMKALERDPLRRPATPLDLAGALEGPRAHVGRASVVVLTIAFLAGVLVVGQLLRTGPPPPTKPGSTETVPVMRRSVAVVGFRNLSGRAEAAWLSTALTDMIASEVAASGSLRTIPGENVSEMKAELSLQDVESFGPATLGRIQERVGADVVVVGSFVETGRSQLRLDLVIQDARAGETTGTVIAEGSRDDLIDLVSRAGDDLREKLGVVSAIGGRTVSLRSAFPSDTEVLRAYAEGVERARQHDFIAARRLLEVAVARDPSFALGHAAVGEACAALGYSACAMEAGQRAVELARSLSQEDQTWIEGRYREATAQWDRASVLFGRLFSELPDNLEYGLHLANAQWRAQKGAAALATVARLRRLPGAPDPRIDLAEAAAHGVLEDYPAMLDASRRAGRAASLVGAQRLGAEALLAEARALRMLGGISRGIEAAEEAHRLYVDAGEAQQAATTLLTLGNLMTDQGHPGEALGSFAEALRIAKEEGFREVAMNAISALAVARANAGELDEAIRMMGDATAIATELGDPKAEIRHIANVGLFLSRQGRIGESQLKLEEALVRAREARSLIDEAWLLWDLGDLAQARGDLVAVIDTWGRASALARDAGNTTLRVRAGATTAIQMHEMGHVDAARRVMEGLQAVARESGDASSLILTTRNLGYFHEQAGDLDRGELLLEEALLLTRQVCHDRLQRSVLRELSIIARFRGRLDDAAGRIALARRLVGRRDDAGEILFDVDVELASECYAEAEVDARAALSKAAGLQDFDGTTLALTKLALTSLRQDRCDESSAYIAPALSRASMTPPGIRITMERAAALVDAACVGDLAVARTRVGGAIADAKRLGLYPHDLEGRLVAAEIERRWGDEVRGLEDLRRLRDEARGRGFHLFANRADRLLAPQPMP